MNGFSRKILTVVVAVFFCIAFISALLPADLSHDSPSFVFEIKNGEGFRAIANDLSSAGLVRSKFVFELYAFIVGDARLLRPGFYRLSSSMSVLQIAHILAGGKGQGITVTIPEGSNLYQIDGILSSALVEKPGVFIAYAKGRNLEGYLFPDTYQFMSEEPPSDIVKTMTDTFHEKTANIFLENTGKASTTVILASILEKEVSSDADRKIVAGILEKRLTIGIPLDVDATVCYAKQVMHPSITINCAALTSADFKVDSPYNTYLYRGLPPGPIGNPGIDAMKDVLSVQSSPYLYYLSDPKTGKTIYAETLGIQEANQRKYLGN